jgi:hypothetical protein
MATSRGRKKLWLLPVALVLPLLLAVLAGPAAALQDDQVQALARSDRGFREAENRILGVWENLPKNFRSSIRAEQIDWIKYDRNQDARALMDRGRTFAEAYAEATHERSDYLERMAYGYVRTGIRDRRENDGGGRDAGSPDPGNNANRERNPAGGGPAGSGGSDGQGTAGYNLGPLDSINNSDDNAPKIPRNVPDVSGVQTQGQPQQQQQYQRTQPQKHNVGQIPGVVSVERLERNNSGGVSYRVTCAKGTSEVVEQRNGSWYWGVVTSKVDVPDSSGIEAVAKFWCE